MQIHGWGNYPKAEAEVVNPLSVASCKHAIQKLPSLHGAWAEVTEIAPIHRLFYRPRIWITILFFDAVQGTLTCESGVKLRDILNLIVPKGWFLPVTPGTSFVTVGGAIASDVHGKNHHAAGTFCQHVTAITMLLGTGEVVTTSPLHKADLFHATCGGMGLTGVILTATIQLIPIKSAFIAQKTIKAGCLEAACEAFEAHYQSTYSVAWIDCLATGKSLGRSVLMVGEHADNGGLSLTIKDPISVPLHTPAALLNSMTMRAFNKTYYAKAAHNKLQTVPLMPYFYPLDAIGGWNKLYGKAGFVQYQFALPKTDGMAKMRSILNKISQSGQGSFLAVLKQFGPANRNLLSFPIEGYTLALDFKMSTTTIEFLNKLDDEVAGMGGRIYLAKDAVMRETSFKTMYPNWEQFEAVRQKYGAIGKFASDQSRRMGLA